MKHPFYKRQKGFTLLELLVVITLLAVLAVGALVAYDRVGDNAQATAAASNAGGVDRAVRNFRAVSLAYPDQWDNLYVTGTNSKALLAAKTQALLSPVSEAGFGTALSDVLTSLKNVGITHVQNIVADTDLTPGTAPNLMHNEGSNPNAKQVVVGVGTVAGLAILADHDGAAVCTVGGTAMPANYAGTAVDKTFGERLNKINDTLEGDNCDLVVALGFGHDAAHSTTDSKVAIAQAPTFTSKNINPANNYARYIGLFHVGSNTGTGNINVGETGEIHDQAHFIGFIDPEGNTIDDNLNSANAS